MGFKIARHAWREEAVLNMPCDKNEDSRTYEQLLESEAHYRRLVELGPQMSWRAAPDGRVTAMSPNWLSFTGISHEEALGDGWAALQHPDDAPRILALVQRVIETGEPYDARHRIRAADGSYRWMGSRAAPWRDHDGTVTQWYGTTEDINDLVEAQRALDHQTAAFRALANAAPQIAWTAGNNGSWTWFNDYLFHYTGLPPERALEFGWRDLVHPDHLERVYQGAAQCWETGAPWEDTFPVKAHDGTYRWFLCRAVAISIDDKRTGWVGTGMDVTGMLETKDALAAANEAKTRLVSAVSHDLRQPLQSLTLFASALDGDPEIKGRSRAALGHLRSSIDRMGHLLESMLQIASIDLGKAVTQKGEVVLQQMFDDLAAEMEPQAAAKGLRLKVVPTSAVILSDPTLLMTIVRNLLTNAIRYTEQGTVLLGCRRRGSEVAIKVCDSGIGISRDKLRAIFEEFYQVGNSERDANLGLGLGLSIVERLARQLGHHITVRSTEGKGSAFAILVPRATP